MIKRIYIAATNQHVGKTTSTLGLVSALIGRGFKVGYCKPVGQEFVDLGDLKVDKDALLFSKTLGFELVDSLHSPVIVGKGVTTKYLDNPTQYDFSEKIKSAAKKLERENDIVIYEGTGHPGVGSVIDLSNADVAALLQAPVIMIVKGGVGRTIDALNTNLALFREKKVPILGVIINKVMPSRVEKVRHYVGMKLKEWDIPILAILPFEKSLSNPIMETIRQAVQGKIIVNEISLANKIENIVSGALIERGEFESLNNLLLIVNYRRLDRSVKCLLEIAEQKSDSELSIAGILLHGEKNVSDDFIDRMDCKDFILKNKIPVVSTSLDTYGSAKRIHKIEVKINTRTPWKVQKAIELIKEHIDLEKVINF